MFMLNGSFGTAKVFTDICEVEAQNQIVGILNQPFAEDANVRIMPDVHAGKGCTIGTTMKIKDKVCPNLVGVDIGCIDRETEVLTPTGWIKICDYNGEDILLYNENTDLAHFEQPNAFIKLPCDEFYHFQNTKNLDQMFSEEHRMLVYQGTKSRGFKKRDYFAKDFVEKTSNVAKLDFYTVKTTFNIDNSRMNYCDDDIRIFVMISADGHLRKLVNGSFYTELHFRKQRKIDRAEMLLNNVGVDYKKSARADGSTCISFSSYIYNTKDLRQFYNASYQQLQVICDEVFYWDGTVDEKRGHRFYSSTVKGNADLVQFAFNSTGIRASIYVNKSENSNWNDVYVVTPTKNEYVAYRKDMITKVKSEDGYKYCFNTSTGAFVIRRNNCISVTGNCGMAVYRINGVNEADLDKFLSKLDRVISQFVPSGMEVNEVPVSDAAKTEKELRQLTCFNEINIERALLSIGSLGGGNHFIEVDRDSKGNLFLVIHSGSRNLGVQVAKFFQEKAVEQLEDTSAKRKEIIAQLKAEGRQSEIESALASIESVKVNRDMAYCEGDLFNDYIHDMAITQRYATTNRKNIAKTIASHFDDITFTHEFTTIHNYIDIDTMTLRKGAVSAKFGEMLLIPMNMRDGSLLCRGKGNEDWNCSAPHGAGRLMSRSKAKEVISLAEFRESMEGIASSSVVTSTIDEAPMAYKPMESIVENVKDSVEIVDVLKPVYNYKAH